MDYKERYKNALKRAEGIIRYYKEHNRSDETSIEDLEVIFPELKESEDEKIRRNIIAALKGEGYYDCDLTNECIAWLEKQGEHDETSIAIKNQEAYRIGFADGEAHAKEEMNVWSDEDEENLQHCCGAVFAADYYTYEDKQDMEKWLLQLKEKLS